MKRIRKIVTFIALATCHPVLEAQITKTTKVRPLTGQRSSIAAPKASTESQGYMRSSSVGARQVGPYVQQMPGQGMLFQPRRGTFTNFGQPAFTPAGPNRLFSTAREIPDFEKEVDEFKAYLETNPTKREATKAYNRLLKKIEPSLYNYSAASKEAMARAKDILKNFEIGKAKRVKGYGWHWLLERAGMKYRKQKEEEEKLRQQQGPLGIMKQGQEEIKAEPSPASFDKALEDYVKVLKTNPSLRDEGKAFADLMRKINPNFYQGASEGIQRKSNAVTRDAIDLHKAFKEKMQGGKGAEETIFKQTEYYKAHEEEFTQEAFNGFLSRAKRISEFTAAVFLLLCFVWFEKDLIMGYLGGEKEGEDALNEAFKKVIMQDYLPLEEATVRQNLIFALVDYILYHPDAITEEELEHIKRFYIREKPLANPSERTRKEAREALFMLIQKGLFKPQDVRDILKAYWFYERWYYGLPSAQQVTHPQ